MQLNPGLRKDKMISKYNTDKYSTGLISKYERLFSGLKHEKITLLEIGVYYGGSMRWLREYFTHPETKIIGIDHQPCLTPQDSDNFIFYLCDQNDSNKLHEIGSEHGWFDIIIDDGSHHAKETLNCFNNLWKFVRPGGWYLIEDWSQQDDNIESILNIMSRLRQPDPNGGTESSPNLLGVSEMVVLPLSENSPEDILQSGNVLGKFNTGLIGIRKKDV